MATPSALTPTVLSSYTLANGITVRNRLVMAPMTRGRADHSRVPSQLMVEHYTQRSSAGMIIVESTSISEQANGWPQSPGIYTQEMVEGWRPVIRSVKAAGGAAMVCQLWHTGRASHSSYQPHGALPVAPSAIPIPDAGGRGLDDNMHPRETPRALEIDEIPAIVNDFRTAAVNAFEAGFDMVEVHSASGFLPDQFLQSSTNKRTDLYGGSIENRFRFLREIVEAVSHVCPANKIGVRLSPNSAGNGMGSEDNVETFVYAAAELEKLGVGYIHLVDGVSFGTHGKCRPVNLSDIRRVYSGTIIGSMGYTKEVADGALRSGAADLISFGRPFLANPDLVERFANNWPLQDANFATFFTHGAEGYNDYPFYQKSAEASEPVPAVAN